MIFLLFPAIQFLMDDVRCGVDVALDDSSMKKAEKNITDSLLFQHHFRASSECLSVHKAATATVVKSSFAWHEISQ